VRSWRIVARSHQVVRVAGVDVLGVPKRSVAVMIVEGAMMLRFLDEPRVVGGRGRDVVARMVEVDGSSGIRLIASTGMNDLCSPMPRNPRVPLAGIGLCVPGRR